MCAGDTEVIQGACEGDSGGPLLYKDVIARKYIQIATVEGGVGDCGDRAYPGIFVRLNHPSIWEFISSTMKRKILICQYYFFQYFDNNFEYNNLVVKQIYAF